MTQESNQLNQEITQKDSANQAEMQNSSTQNPQSNTAASAAAVKKSDDGSGGVVKEFYDKAKQTAGQVSEKAAEKIDEKKSVVTEGLSGVAESIRQVGENMRGNQSEENPIAQFTGKYGDALATQVENLSNYFDRKNVREIVRDVESFARRNPAVFIGGAFALGILAARFLKSSSPSISGSNYQTSHSENQKYINGETAANANPS